MPDLDTTGPEMPKSFFIPITKIDKARHEVYGWAATEAPDGANEAMDYDSSKPFFERWSQSAQKRSSGRSRGNLREMHSNSAVGKLIDLTLDDQKKGVYVGAKVVDDASWKKVEEGVLTGFSIGGNYARRWTDPNNPGVIKYTANISELSLVDSPCNPDATFQLVKADGMTTEHFAPGNSGAALMIEVDYDETEGESEPMEKAAKIDECIPESPEPITTTNLAPPGKNAYPLENMPGPSSTMELKPTAIVTATAPAQDELQARAVNSRDISAAFDEWLPKVGSMVESAAEKAVTKALAGIEFVDLTKVEDGEEKADAPNMLENKEVPNIFDPESPYSPEEQPDAPVADTELEKAEDEDTDTDTEAETVNLFDDLEKVEPEEESLNMFEGVDLDEQAPAPEAEATPVAEAVKKMCKVTRKVSKMVKVKSRMVRVTRN
jgi:hypothetical protein